MWSMGLRRLGVTLMGLNGTGTVAIRGSGNVSSLTDEGTGSCAINITSAFANTSVSCPSSTHASGVAWMASTISYARATSTVSYGAASISGTSTDAYLNSVASFGDLA